MRLGLEEEKGGRTLEIQKQRTPDRGGNRKDSMNKKYQNNRTTNRRIKKKKSVSREGGVNRGQQVFPPTGLADVQEKKKKKIVGNKKRTQ